MVALRVQLWKLFFGRWLCIADTGGDAAPWEILNRVPCKQFDMADLLSYNLVGGVTRGDDI